MRAVRSSASWAPETINTCSAVHFTPRDPGAGWRKLAANGAPPPAPTKWSEINRARADAREMPARGGRPTHETAADGAHTKTARYAGVAALIPDAVHAHRASVQAALRLHTFQIPSGPRHNLPTSTGQRRSRWLPAKDGRQRRDRASQATALPDAAARRESRPATLRTATGTR